MLAIEEAALVLVFHDDNMFKNDLALLFEINYDPLLSNRSL